MRHRGIQLEGACKAKPVRVCMVAGSKFERITAGVNRRDAVATRSSSAEYRFGGKATITRLRPRRRRTDSIGGARSLSPDITVATSNASSRSRTAMFTAVFFTSFSGHVLPQELQVTLLERKCP